MNEDLEKKIKVVFDIMAGDCEIDGISEDQKQDEGYLSEKKLYNLELGCKAAREAVERHKNLQLILTCSAERFILKQFTDAFSLVAFELADLIEKGKVSLYRSKCVADHGKDPKEAYKKSNTTTDAVKLLLGEINRGGKIELKRIKKDEKEIIVFNADAVVSSGNTGLYAYSVDQIINNSEVEEISELALKGLMFFPLVAKVPTKFGTFVYGADLGASTVAYSSSLEKYTILVDSLLRKKGYDNPRIGLLNIGSEATKGRRLYRQAYENLQRFKEADGINFIGNVEVKQIKNGEVDGFVCNGDNGNLFLKTVEAYAPFVLDILSSPLRKIFEFSIFCTTSTARRICDKMNYDAAIILGYDIPIIKTHGESDDKELYRAIRTAINYSKIAKAVNDQARIKLKEYNEFLKNKKIEKLV